MITIGIDTGGTCTDAVIYDSETGQVLATGKTLTTRDNLERGIGKALDQLPEELFKKAECFSLSTTLATNASVENKGCRAKLLIMGAPADMIERLQDALARYGITDISQLVALDAKPENLYSTPLDPDWDELRKQAPELFAGCDCVGIVQTYPAFNGGRFELTALRILSEELTIPLTTAYDITQEVDFLEICASILLNARLIPLITDFIKAVHHVMEQRGIDLPISIVRSDGTLMSEEMTRSCPVETLLCGPVASVIGGCTLANEENAIVVDMGGTTTDLAMVVEGEPLIAKSGIHIGQYKTAIHGLDAKACSLGGDTAIRFDNRKMYLDTVRIVPISILASMYDNVLPDLIKFREEKVRHTRPVHEFYVLQKDIAGKEEYTDHEKKACALLKGHPMMVRDFAAALGCKDIYSLNVARLEQEGVLIRSGITPTDMMVLKGDLTLYDDTAAKEMMKCAACQMDRLGEEDMIPDEGYDLVVQRLYETIALFMLQHEYPGDKYFENPENTDHLMTLLYKQACKRLLDEADADVPAFGGYLYGEDTNTDVYDNAGEDAKVLAEESANAVALAGSRAEAKAAKKKAKNMSIPISDVGLTTTFPLIGIGAPTHVFLPRVARLLGTRAITQEYAPVANALGAAVCKRISRWDLLVKVIYKNGIINGYSVMDGTELKKFSKLADAIEEGKKITYKNIKNRAVIQGLGEDAIIEITTEEDCLDNGALMNVVIHGVAR